MVQEKDEFLRKRVLYIGSAVPLDTAEGLDGVQKPLLERYPIDDDNNIEGILSHLSIVANGITLQYVSDPARILYFPITSLTLCAAVRCVTTTNTTTGEKAARFVSLSNPAAGGPNSRRPAIFTTITRRTEGRKVLECHGFICSSSKDALELVQWTSYADRLAKGKVNGPGSMPPAGSTFHLDGGPSTPRAFETNTLRSTTANSVAGAGAPVAGADGEHPVRLVSGEAVSQRVAPEFYEPVPTHGYFYKTRDSQIKTYTVERVTDGESERLRAISTNAYQTMPRPGPPPMPQQVHQGPPSERRYVASPPPPMPMANGGAMTLPHPQARTFIPVRPMPSQPQPVIRPRFFSPPPPMMRPRPTMMVPPGHMMAPPGHIMAPPGHIMAPPGHIMARDPYVFLPPPPRVIDAPYVVRRPRPTRRSGSDTSSRGSSGSSSPDSPREMNGRRGMVNGDGADGSSDVSSRPRTPPTDYEQRGPRASRKDQFERSRYLNGGPPPMAYATLPPPRGHPGHPGHPFELYLYPRYPYPGGYSPYVMERARSVPPPMHRGKSKDRKKGHRSGKKDKKRHGHGRRHYGDPSDISTDSVGYQSEIGPGGDYPGMPREYRRFEKQFKHERAFSKSLAEENHRFPGEVAGNAYSLNEHMAQRAGPGDAEFNMY